MSRKTSIIELRKLKLRKKPQKDKDKKILAGLLNISSDSDLRKIVEERLRK